MRARLQKISLGPTLRARYPRTVADRQTPFLIGVLLLTVLPAPARAQGPEAATGSSGPQTDRRSRSPERRGPQIVFGGDVLYDAPLAYQLRRRARAIGRRAAYREVFADLAPALRTADLAVVNLEVPISNRYRERSAAEDVPVFRAPPDFLDALDAAGVDAVTVANNHAYDQGLRGLRSTQRAARARSMGLIGVGADAREASAATVFAVGDARIAIAAWTEGTNHRPRDAEGTSPRIALLRDNNVRRTIESARAQAQLVVAVFHWIREDLVRPRPMMREVAREAAEAGADLVIGHGTHVPGQTEVIQTQDGRRVTVLYSLGNLLAAMEQPAGQLNARAVGVRDAPLAMIETRWARDRLEVAAVRLRYHWIARPLGLAPWMEGGSLPVARTVSLDAELERLARSACGSRCDRRAAMYRRRIALMDRAMVNVHAPAVSGSERADRQLASAAAAPSAAGSRGARFATHTRAGRARTEPPRTSRRPSRVVIPDSDPRLRPYLRGQVFPITFVPGAVQERTVGARALAEIVALMRA
ncbi:MAG TPA: CapA family protein, partial [Polyangiaceae bacterium]|nr:CapA family protein [Polyangiaceae bacterium]